MFLYIFIVSWEDYAYILYLFFANHGTLFTVPSFPNTSPSAASFLLNSPPSQTFTHSTAEIYSPSRPYFVTHNLIGVGHSMAATAFLLTLTYPPTPTFPTLAFPTTSTSFATTVQSSNARRSPYTAFIFVDRIPSNPQPHPSKSSSQSHEYFDPHHQRRNRSSYPKYSQLNTPAGFQSSYS